MSIGSCTIGANSQILIILLIGIGNLIFWGAFQQGKDIFCWYGQCML